MDRFKFLISAFLPKSATTDISTTDIPAVADTAAIGTAGAGTKSAAGGARIRAEQLRVFAELQSRAFYFAPPTLAFFAASFAIEWVNPWHAALWWASMMIVMMTNHLTVKNFSASLPGEPTFRTNGSGNGTLCWQPRASPSPLPGQALPLFSGWTAIFSITR